MDAEDQFWVRVLLLDDVASCCVNSETALNVTDCTSDITNADFEQTDGALSVRIYAGKIKIANHLLLTSQVVITPEDPYIFNLNGDDYRGKLKLILNSDAQSFDVINLAQ